MHAMTFKIIHFFLLVRIFRLTSLQQSLNQYQAGATLVALPLLYPHGSVFLVFPLSVSSFLPCVLQFLASQYDLQLCHRRVVVIYATAYWFVHYSTCVTHYHNRRVICSLHSSATAQVTLSHDSRVEITRSAICYRAPYLDVESMNETNILVTQKPSAKTSVFTLNVQSKNNT